jgi:TonB family protein
VPTPVKTTLKPENRRLLAALLASVMLHLIPLASGWLPYGNKGEPARQITFSATLQPLRAPPLAKPENSPAREKTKKDGPERKKKRAHPSPERGKMRAVMDSAALRTEKRKGAAPEKAPVRNGDPQDAGTQDAVSRGDSRPDNGNDSGPAAIDTANTPIYPEEAVRLGLESCVLAAVQVSAAGEVTAVHILHADVAGVFDQSVIDAQSAVRYLPARRNGENLPSRILAVASFTLEAGRHLNCARQYAVAARRINALPASAEIGAAMLEGWIGKY